MNCEEYIGKILEVKIDRCMGSKHPEHEFIYPINYGYIPNTISGDGEELDCYILGVFKPIENFTGECIAIIHRINDDDDKLIIVPQGHNYTNKEIEALVQFQERFFKHEIIRKEAEFNSLIPELSVSNIEMSKKFYKELGFKIVYERAENKFCFLQLEDNQIMIEEVNGNWNVGDLKYPYGNGMNLSMSVKDVESLYNEIKRKNLEIFVELGTHNYMVNDKVYEDKEFLIQDPNGYLLRFNN